MSAESIESTSARGAGADDAAGVAEAGGKGVVLDLTGVCADKFATVLRMKRRQRIRKAQRNISALKA